jgi:hypothetical protein
MGGGASKEKVEKMAAEFQAEDNNSDGRVSLEEFKAYHKKGEGACLNRPHVAHHFVLTDLCRLVGCLRRS